MVPTVMNLMKMLLMLGGAAAAALTGIAAYAEAHRAPDQP
jgi:hypothetical protein